MTNEQMDAAMAVPGHKSADVATWTAQQAVAFMAAEMATYRPDIKAKCIDSVIAVAELIESAGKAQDTNRDDFVLGRPDVSRLPEAERAAFLRGWDAASEAVFRTGLRAALARVQGAGA